MQYHIDTLVILILSLLVGIPVAFSVGITLTEHIASLVSQQSIEVTLEETIYE